MRKHALFIGNGLNRASDNKAWTDMLDQIRKKYDVETSHHCTNLPLEFERIYLDARKDCKLSNTYQLKRDIVSSIPNVTSLSLHSRFTSLPIEDFITTNYDYYLEQSINPVFLRKEISSHTNERKNSLFRRIDVDQKKVWHIHGEAHCPDSICLGYDQYCTYLSKIVNYLTQPPSNASRKPLLRYLTDGGALDHESWPIMFFTHDIFIVGLTMSFLEIDLWWLLSYRRRFVLENPQYNISNRIHYFYAVFNGKVDDEKISLLESTGVELHPIPLVRQNWRKLYLAMLLDIERIINSG